MEERVKVQTQVTDEAFKFAIMHSFRITPDETEKVIQRFIDAITTCIKENDGLGIRGFGRFYTKERKARKQKDLQGKIIDVPAVKAIRFLASGALRHKVNS
jgi:nucleoid DNA-binding protein